MSKLDVHCGDCGLSIKRYPTKSGFYFCDIAHKSNWQRKQKELLGYSKEWLIDQYIAQRKSANQIAREIGRDSKRVWEWITDYGIETRPRGNEYGQGYTIGQEGTFKGKRHTQEAKDSMRQNRINDGHVPYLKDGKHWLKGTKGKSPAWKGGVTPERQEVYSSQEWCEAVKNVWARDDATCQKCSKRQNEDRDNKFHIHHIVSFMVRELRTDPNNLILLCVDCHRWVHSKENVNKLFIKE